MSKLTRKRKSVSYAKWGYIFLIPFFATFAVFTLIPLVKTFYYSFFEYYFEGGLKAVGPNFVGIQNFVDIFTRYDLLKFISNTAVMWLIGFVPQLVISMLLAVWFTDLTLKIKGQAFFKTVIYLPNMIMASAFAMLFFALFSDRGPVNSVLNSVGIDSVRFLSYTGTVRGLVGSMNFMMWFGNTTIILMAGVMGIDNSMFEAAQIDGANAWDTFWRITVPMIKPILSYMLITSMIGGLQMFDVPQILTNGVGNPNRESMTLIMLLNNYISKSKNYGMGGALSVILFVITAVISMFMFNYLNKDSRQMQKQRQLASMKGGNK
ncbi:MAG: sugar ABC transporter permease [Clostridia bacterium]|nr:sugar ABC transporter permease [Clostridia bacterium]